MLGVRATEVEEAGVRRSRDGVSDRGHGIGKPVRTARGRGRAEPEDHEYEREESDKATKSHVDLLGSGRPTATRTSTQKPPRSAWIAPHMVSDVRPHP